MKNLFLIMIPIVSFSATAFGQDVIRSTIETPRNMQIAESGVFDTKSGITVYIDTKSLYSRINPDYNEGQSKNIIKNIIDIQVISEEGLRAVNAYLNDPKASGAEQLTDDQIKSLITPISDSVNKIRGFVNHTPGDGIPDEENQRRKDLNARLKNIISSSILENSVEGDTDFIAVCMSIFSKISAYTDTLLVELLRQTVAVQVKLTHLRDPDQSIRRDVRFLEAFNEQDRNAWTNLQSIYKNNQGDPQKLKRQYADRVSELAKAQFSTYSKEISKSYESLKSDLETVSDKIKTAATANSDYELRYSRIRNRIKELPSKVTALFVKYESIDFSNLDPDTITSILSSDISELSSEVNNLVQEVNLFMKQLADTVKDETKGVRFELKQAVDKFKVTWATAEKTFSEFAREAKQLFADTQKAIFAILNLTQNMKIIGESSGPFPDNGVLVYSNVNGTLSGTTSPLISGDEVVFSIIPKPISSTDEYRSEPVASRSYFAYQIGLRTDRVFIMTMAQRSDKQGWRLSPTWSEIFVRGSRSSLESNRLQSVGFGLTFSLLDQNGDDSMEVGTGLSLALLDQKLLVGYGMNWTLNRGYFYAGWRFRID